MGFLKRLLGGGTANPEASTTEREAAEPVGDHTDAGPDDAERARELQVLREDQARQDDLIRRQQRYAAYAWEPPTQGGERRADDGEGETREGH